MNVTVFVVATIWNSLVVWAVIGLVHVLVGLTSGVWDWHNEYLLIWGAFLVLGYLKLWEES